MDTNADFVSFFKGLPMGRAFVVKATSGKVLVPETRLVGANPRKIGQLACAAHKTDVNVFIHYHYDNGDVLTLCQWSYDWRDDKVKRAKTRN